MSDFRRRLMRKKIESELPSGYTRLNYLESTGTQHINMGITPYYVENKQLIVDYKILNDFTENVVLFGASNGIYYCMLFAFTNFDKVGLQWSNVSGDIYYNLYINKDNIRHKINIDGLNKKIVCDNIVYELYTHTIGSTPNNRNFYLFGRNYNNIADRLISARIYSFKIQNGDELYRNFVPALDTKNRPCLYDTVSKQPFYNQGTGEFLYG